MAILFSTMPYVILFGTCAFLSQGTVRAGDHIYICTNTWPSLVFFGTELTIDRSAAYDLPDSNVFPERASQQWICKPPNESTHKRKHNPVIPNLRNRTQLGSLKLHSGFPELPLKKQLSR